MFQQFSTENNMGRITGSKSALHIHLCSIRCISCHWCNR